MVCLGNICRSPTAHGVFLQRIDHRGMADHISVDSAGTGSWHVGEAPDSRAVTAATTRGYDLRQLRARQVVLRDFEHFDYILAMDHANLHALKAQCPDHLAHKIALFLSYSDCKEQEVPDPYYSGPHGFETVLDLVEGAADGLLDQIMARHFNKSA